MGNATLRDPGIISEEDILKRTTFGRKRSFTRELVDFKVSKIKALFFDGRKDRTLVTENGKNIQKVEEHITLVSEPNSIYCGHLKPQSQTAKSITQNIIEYFDYQNIDYTCLKAVGCDGTAVNTGVKGGINALKGAG